MHRKQNWQNKENVNEVTSNYYHRKIKQKNNSVNRYRNEDYSVESKYRGSKHSITQIERLQHRISDRRKPKRKESTRDERGARQNQKAWQC